MSWKLFIKMWVFLNRVSSGKSEEFEFHIRIEFEFHYELSSNLIKLGDGSENHSVFWEFKVRNVGFS